MQADIGLDYWLTLGLWALVLAMVLARAWSQSVVGLTAGYFLQIALIHLFGGLIQLLPWHVSVNRADSLSGFSLTGVAMAGFLVSLILFRPGLLLPRRPRTKAGPPSRHTLRLGWACILTGGFAYFIITGLARFLPGASAVVSNGLNLLVCGLCLAWWYYYRTGQYKDAWMIAMCSLPLPVATVLLDGFIGYGISAIMILCSFVAAGGVPRRTVLLGGIAMTFIGLSLWSVYAVIRPEVRAVVWGGGEIKERADVTLSRATDKLTWLDLGSNQHLASIEHRLNQNYLVGAAKRQIQNNRVDLAEGETIWNALVAIVPRLLWPDKPLFAGSGDLVTRFTGIKFAEGTSVGIGHVMEFYVNFGVAGVFVGFMAIGAILSTLDIAIARFLHTGELEKFLLWYMPALPLLMAGGVLAEAPPSAMGAFLLTLGVTRFVYPSTGKYTLKVGGPQIKRAQGPVQVKA